MSKLPKAPLIEVIFEIKWPINGKAELDEMAYLHGDLYPILREKYPFRETVQTLPMELPIQVPTHRFRTAANDYPLVQVGRGLLTVNTTDSKYFWDDYEARILEVFAAASSVYNFKVPVTMVLQYIDLLKFDFDNNDILRFLKENLKIQVTQGFFEPETSIVKNVILSLNFATDVGSLNVSIGRGKNNQGVDGIAVHTTVNSNPVRPEIESVKEWLKSAHEICSTCFKEMTSGKLYESFKG